MKETCLELSPGELSEYLTPGNTVLCGSGLLLVAQEPSGLYEVLLGVSTDGWPCSLSSLSLEALAGKHSLYLHLQELPRVRH